MTGKQRDILPIMLRRTSKYLTAKFGEVDYS